MNPIAFGTLAALPVAALLALRWRHLRSRMDPRARRTFRIKASGFLALSALASAFLQANQGTIPLPMMWVMALEISAASLLLGLLKRV